MKWKQNVSKKILSKELKRSVNPAQPMTQTAPLILYDSKRYGYKRRLQQVHDTLSRGKLHFQRCLTFFRIYP